MPRFAANLSFLYPEMPFLDRIGAAARDGFDGVECLFPYEHDQVAMVRRLADHGMSQVLFNVSAGDWGAGERGLAARPAAQARFKAAFGEALDWAQALRCPRLHVMSGVVDGDRAGARAVYLDNLAWAAALAAPLGVTLLVEPLNPRDVPGYLLTHQQQAHDIVAALGLPNVKVQMDLYHCQIVEGDLTTRLRQWLPTGQVGHLQIAGVPDRHEPDAGELNADHLFEVIDALGYGGYVGCEYRPRGDTSAGLAWLRRYRSRCPGAAGS